MRNRIPANRISTTPITATANPQLRLLNCHSGAHVRLLLKDPNTMTLTTPSSPKNEVYLVDIISVFGFHRLNFMSIPAAFKSIPSIIR